MMLAMALAHRQRATRAGGGWRREGSAQPPGLCTLLAAIALFLVLVGSATLGVERAVAAVENTRSDRLPAYNSAAMSWRLGGSASFANESRGLELRVNGAPTPLVPRNGTSPEHAVSAEIADARDDVARVGSTHVLYASIPRANTRDGASHGSINGSGSILVPPGVLVTFSVGRRSSDERTKGAKKNVGPAGDDGRGVAFAPFSCAVWSHSRVSARDRVDCDACASAARRASAEASARCAAACDTPGTGRRFVARRAWVVEAELVVEEDADDSSHDSSSFSVPLRRPTNAGCALRYHADVLSRAEWDTAAATRAFCASTEGRGAPRLAPLNRNDENENESHENVTSHLPLAVTVRSSRDPRVVAGALTRCSYDFGPSAREHASSAVFLLLLAFACVAAAAYWSRGRAACFPARLLEEGTDDGGGDGERRAVPGARYAAATRAVPEAERFFDARRGGGREPLEARRAPPRAYVLEPSGRDRRRREREALSAARVVEMAETRGGSGARGGGRGAFAV